MHGQAGAQYVLIISPHPASWNLISYLSCGVVMSAGNDSEAYSDLLEDFFNCKGRTHFYTFNNLFFCLPALNPVHPMTKVQQENGTSQRPCRPYLTRVGRNDT